MKLARFKIPGPVRRGLLKLVKWAGVTLAREGVELIVEKTTPHEPVAKIVPHEQFVVASQFRDRMLKPDGREALDAEIRRLRGQQL